MNRTTPLLAGILVLGLFSCQTPTGTPSAAKTADTTVDQPNPHGGGGQRVPMNEIKDCMAAYQATMAQYGISTDSGKPITKCPPKTYLTTLSENLTYTTFRHWLDSSVNAMDSAAHGANLNLTIVPGICTAKFVADMGQSASRTGRISWFVMLTRIDTSTSLTAQRMQTGGGDGFEIGGIQP